MILSSHGSAAERHRALRANASFRAYRLAGGRPAQTEPNQTASELSEKQQPRHGSKEADLRRVKGTAKLFKPDCFTYKSKRVLIILLAEGQTYVSLWLQGWSVTTQDSHFACV